MHSRIRTNERCYICDFRPNSDASESSVYNSYLESLSDSGNPNRAVFVDPRDGKPVCTACSKIAKLYARDKAREEEDKRLIQQWENSLRLKRALGVGPTVETEKEITSQSTPTEDTAFLAATVSD